MSTTDGNSFEEQDELAKQTLARAISLEIIEKVQPDQLDTTDIVIDDLLELADQGQILPRGTENPFGFGGLDLIAQFIVPALLKALKVLGGDRQPSPDTQRSSAIFLTEQQLAEFALRADFTVGARQLQEITHLINFMVNRYIESGGGANYRPTQRDIDYQTERLEIHRQTLKVFLDRLAMVGITNMTPEIHYGIVHARAGIRRCKDTLRSWGIAVADHADDEPAA